MTSFRNIEEEIAAMLSVPDEELTDEQRAAMDAYLDELGSQEASKVDGFAQFLRLQTATADACKKEGKRLMDKARTAESRISWLKTRYLNIMLQNGLKKVQGDAYALTIRESEIVVVPDDISALEAEETFVRRKVTIEPNKVAIRDALKAGQQVPGCELRTSYSLQVR